VLNNILMCSHSHEALLLDFAFSLHYVFTGDVEFACCSVVRSAVSNVCIFHCEYLHIHLYVT